ncbi:MAG: diacylglycerol kinase family lipid kinase [Actinobacteria bacterium]|nr:diacylglycerol kinase family lipid kinase [Actinomycetota bacterium]
MAKTLLLYNILSSGINARIIKKVSDVLKNRGFFIEKIETSKVGEAAEKLKNYLNDNKDLEMVVAVGGDGIINEAINVLAYTKIPLGIIPRGTGNAFAKDRKIPFYIKKAVDVFKKENIREIDLGIINDEKYFLMMCSCGFDVKALSALNPNLKKKFKILAYIYHGFKAFFTYKPVEVILRITDEKVLCKGYFCIVSNVRSYGFPMAQIAPDATIDDGVLDICMFMSRDKLSSIANILAIFVKMHINFKNVFYSRTAAEVIIEQDFTEDFNSDNKVPLRVQADGDIYCNLPVKIKVAKKALNIFLP